MLRAKQTNTKIIKLLALSALNFSAMAPAATIKPYGLSSAVGCMATREAVENTLLPDPKQADGWSTDVNLLNKQEDAIAKQNTPSTATRTFSILHDPAQLGGAANNAAKGTLTFLNAGASSKLGSSSALGQLRTFAGKLFALGSDAWQTVMPGLAMGKLQSSNIANYPIKRLGGRRISADMAQLSKFYGSDSRRTNLIWSGTAWVEDPEAKANCDATLATCENTTDFATDTAGNAIIAPSMLAGDMVNVQTYAKTDSAADSIKYDTGIGVPIAAAAQYKPYEYLSFLQLNPSAFTAQRAATADKCLFSMLTSLLGVAQSSATSPVEVLEADITASGDLGHSRTLSSQDAYFANLEMHNVLNKNFSTENPFLPWKTDYSSDDIETSLTEFTNWFESLRDGISGQTTVDAKTVGIARKIEPYIQSTAGAMNQAAPATHHVINKQINKINYQDLLVHFDTAHCDKVLNSPGSSTGTFLYPNQLRTIGNTTPNTFASRMNSAPTTTASRSPTAGVMEEYKALKHTLSQYNDFSLSQLISELATFQTSLKSELRSSAMGIMLQVVLREAKKLPSGIGSTDFQAWLVNESESTGGVLFKAKQAAAMFLDSKFYSSELDRASTWNNVTYKAAKDKLAKTDVVLYIPGKAVKIVQPDSTEVEVAANGRTLYTPDLAVARTNSVFNVYDNGVSSLDAPQINRFKALFQIIDALQLFGDDFYNKLADNNPGKDYVGTTDKGLKYIKFSANTNTTEMTALINAVGNVQLEVTVDGATPTFPVANGFNSTKQVATILANAHKTMQIVGAPFIKSPLAYALDHLRYAYDHAQAAFRSLPTANQFGNTADSVDLFAQLFTYGNATTGQSKPWMLGHKDREKQNQNQGYMPFAYMPMIWRAANSAADDAGYTGSGNNTQYKLVVKPSGNSISKSINLADRAALTGFKDEFGQNLASANAARHEASFIAPEAVQIAEAISAAIEEQIQGNMVLAVTS